MIAAPREGWTLGVFAAATDGPRCSPGLRSWRARRAGL